MRGAKITTTEVHYLDSSARDFRHADHAMRVGTWCGDFVKTNQATTIAGRVNCAGCKQAMTGGKASSSATPAPFDGAIREQIEGAIRFLRQGGTYRATLDDHEFTIIRAEAPVAEFLIVCRTCERLISEGEVTRRVYPMIHKHTKEPISHG